jgi:hypothetical protein
LHQSKKQSISNFMGFEPKKLKFALNLRLLMNGSSLCMICWEPYKIIGICMVLEILKFKNHTNSYDFFIKMKISKKAPKNQNRGSTVTNIFEENSVPSHMILFLYLCLQYF